MAGLIASEIMDEAALLLNDVNKITFTYAIQTPWLKRAVNQFSDELAVNSIPLLHKTNTVVYPTVGVTTYIVMPSDCLYPELLEERALGSSDDWVALIPVEKLNPNIIAENGFRVWSFQGTLLNSVPVIDVPNATSSREVRVTYQRFLPYSTITDISDLGASLTFPSKGYLASKTAEFIARFVLQNAKRGDELKEESFSSLYKIIQIWTKIRQKFPTRHSKFAAQLIDIYPISGPISSNSSSSSSCISYKTVVNVKCPDYGAIGDGASHPLSDRYSSLGLAQSFYPSALALTDEIDTVAIQKAIDANRGNIIYTPRGSYRITRQLSSIDPTTATFFTKSWKLDGDGIGETIFLDGVANAAMLKMDTTTSLHFQFNPQLTNFEIAPLGTPVNSDGIELEKGYFIDIEKVYIHGLTGHGIHLISLLGDPDAQIFVKLIDVWIDGNAKWGIYAEMADNHSEMSWFSMKHVYVARCGSIGVPDSGGVKWRGSISTMEDCTITQNRNYGYWNYPPATSGVGNLLNLTRVDFEHNYDYQAVFESCESLTAIQCSMLCAKDFSPSAKGFLFNTASLSNKLVRNGLISGTKVRVDVDNFVAFEAVAGSNTKNIRIEDTSWAQFDNPTGTSGQVRFKDNGVSEWHVRDEGIEYPAGRAAIAVAMLVGNVTGNAAANTLNLVGHGLSNGDVFRLTTTGTLPAPLATGVDYTVINKTANDFQVMQTPGGIFAVSGTLIDITSAGTGTHSIAVSYTLDPSRYDSYRIKLITAGNYTITFPNTAPQPGADNFGKLIILDILNASGGAVVVTLGGLITQVGYTNPGAGLRRSTFIYNNPFEGWVQVGAWSA